MGNSVRLTADECAVCERLAGRAATLTESVASAARRQGVHLLIGASLDLKERAHPWGERLLRELRTAAVLYERRETLLHQTLNAFADAGIDVLIVKGAALAYVAYAAPYLRPRVDLDLLIAREAVDRAERVLSGNGWVRDIEPDAELAAAQRHYTKSLGSRGDVEYLDLHWRVLNPMAFAHAVSFEELRSRARAIPALGESARTLATSDALFLACLHLEIHHRENAGGEAAGPRLLWLLDIHLLSEGLTAVDRQRFVAQVMEKDVAAICRRALEPAFECFGAASISSLLSDLPISSGEPRYHAVSLIALLRADLAAIPSWTQRARLLREHLFPPFPYIRSKYPTWPSVLLPIASLHRIIVGAPKWFRRVR